MISLYLKDSVLTTQSRTFIEELKPKKNVKTFLQKKYVFCTCSVAIQLSNLFLKKKFSLYSAALNRKKLEDSFFFFCTHRVLCYLSAFGLPELDLIKLSRQPLFPKISKKIRRGTLFSVRPRVTNLQV